MEYRPSIHQRKHRHADRKLSRYATCHLSRLYRRVGAGQSKKLKAAAAALYTKGPSAAEAAAWGLTLEEASGPPVEIWPDNVMAVNVFVAMSTQWRTSVSGATGLDYGVLPHVMRLVGVGVKDRTAVFDAIRLMEDAALEMMRVKK